MGQELPLSCSKYSLPMLLVALRAGRGEEQRDGTRTRVRGKQNTEREAECPRPASPSCRCAEDELFEKEKSRTERGRLSSFQIPLLPL